jgi:hypothetical protein
MAQNSVKSVDSGLSNTGIDYYRAEAIRSVAANEVEVTEFTTRELFDQECPTWTFKLPT